VLRPPRLAPARAAGVGGCLTPAARSKGGGAGGVRMSFCGDSTRPPTHPSATGRIGMNAPSIGRLPRVRRPTDSLQAGTGIDARGVDLPALL